MTRTYTLLSILVAIGVASLAPTRAAACGGFFCDNSQPVNQAAERIIFSRADDGTVTAVIQILYSGPSERFAWMLPVPGVPEIAISSNTAFARLQTATNPQYQLTTIVEGSCRGDSFVTSADRGGAADGAAGADAGVEGPPVTVVDSGAVGPYDYVIISVDSTVEDPAAEAVAWLRSNDYDVSEFGADRLGPYLEGGMNLLAFRLTKGNDAGAIRPVVIGFGSGLPSIPIRPTAVAATDDMGVMVWVLGPSRAVPVNYASLELNEALIDWINPNRNYNDVVTRAANEAGGQGFVTEMAGDAAPLGDTIFSASELDAWTAIRTSDWAGRHGDLLTRTMNRYAGFDGMREVLERTLPLPEGVTIEELLACPFCYLDGTAATIAGFDPTVYLAEVDRDVIQPMAATAALFRDAPFVTRLYTTMSADEMTMDPIFDFNADLGPYSNTHTADRIIECSPSISRFDAPWRVELADGTVVRGEGNTWPFSVDEGDLPANIRVRRIGNTGTGTVITDNSTAIAETIAEHNARIPRAVTDGGCSVGGGGSSAGLLGLLFATAMLAFRRRRSGS